MLLNLLIIGDTQRWTFCKTKAVSNRLYIVKLNTNFHWGSYSDNLR